MKIVVANAAEDQQGRSETSLVTLPCIMDEIGRAASSMNLDDQCKGDFEIVGVALGSLAGMLKQIPTTGVSLKELNLLACQLDGFTEKQRAEYCAVLTDRGELPVKNLINYAFDTAAGRYKVRYGVRNYNDLGMQFVKQVAPGLPHEIADNILYDNVGYALEADGGKLTGIGFVENYSDHFKPTYTGDNLGKLMNAYSTNEPCDFMSSHQERNGAVSQCM